MLNRSMQVKDFMTRSVVTIEPEAPIVKAANLMLQHKISGLPVIDCERHVVGIVSEHDLLRRRGQSDRGSECHWLRLMIDGVQLESESEWFRLGKVQDVMTSNPLLALPATSLAEAARTIQGHCIKRLPVVDQGVLVGVVARADLLRAFAMENEAANPDDSADECFNELERENWRRRARAPRGL